MSTERVGILVAVTALTGVGLLLLLRVGLGSLRRLRVWEAGAKRAEATVLRYERRRYKGNDYYSPVLRFTTPAGQDVVFEARRSVTGPEPPPGGVVDVLYDAADPQVARLPGQDRAGALVVAGIGALLLVVAAGLTVGLAVSW